MKGKTPVSNGTLPSKQNSVTKDVIALLLILLGVICVLVGVYLVLGWGGVLVVFGVSVTYIGVRLGFSKTGKE
jgi:hypothetical protein